MISYSNKMKASHLLLSCVLVFSVLEACQGGALRKNFYERSCPRAEDIVRTTTWKHTATNSALPAKFLRMHFHDCFVRGCDASILIDSTTNKTAEKAALPNRSLRGFDVIDDIKGELEKECPGTVSCADILALAARDAVSFQFQKPIWDVLTGRRDGKISRKNEALANIPQPTFNFSQLKQSYASKGLNVHDLVVLSGGHTIGKGRCNFFSNRLYNITGKVDQDPSLKPTYAATLKAQCKNLNSTAPVDNDPGSTLNFDSHYFAILKQNMGLFQSDAALLTDKSSRKFVDGLISNSKFLKEFGQSMERMGAIGVLTGNSGEIRKKCRVVNP